MRSRARGAGLRALGVARGTGFYDDAPTARTVSELARLRLHNLVSRRDVRGTGDAVVVMTTVAPRIHLVWAAIESIARGSERPRRLVLWLDDPSLATLPSSLQRLERRGLEVRHVEPGLGVHTKWFPQVDGGAPHRSAIVTSDDDQLYPRAWLADLLGAAARHPGAVIAHRAHRIEVEGSAPKPYVEWRPVAHTRPSFAGFGTSVSGQLLPVQLLEALRERGRAFLELTPTADDVWLHATAVRAGIRTAQVREVAANYPFVPGTQTTGLYWHNVFGEGNDRQISAALGASEIERIAADD
ncbi:hypothetical protein SAMN04487783_1755 [Agrococcus baldri]|uniref:Glycosyltransferase n=2 Tax=Agrococcus baldri TaxID=153730 RepID=A0AA94KZX4_9MICO|nr:hypothetical protein SAMN04487783_1755 [Agrococcus baldri]